MKWSLRESRLQHLIRHRNGYLLLATGSMALNILLVIYCFTLIGHERVILLPPEISKSFWVDGEHVSPNYLSEMGLFFTHLRLNATQDNINLQQTILLRYIHPELYARMKSDLIIEAERVKTSHLSLIFHPVNLKVDAKKWIVQITGDLQVMIGQDPQPSKRVTYQIAFTYDSGRLLVKSFEEVRDHG